MLPERRYIETGTPVVMPVPSTSHVAIGFRSDWPCNQGKSHILVTHWIYLPYIAGKII
jgi:hypothetical protein